MTETYDTNTAPRTGATTNAASAPSAPRARSAPKAKEAAGTMASSEAAVTQGPQGTHGTQATQGTKGTSGPTEAVPDAPNGPTFPVLPPSEHDELTHRLHHAVSGFVDAPRDAVQEADLLLDELSGRLTKLLADRRRTLRDAWRENESGTVQTEELRLAMRGYRNVLERLLSV